MSSLASNGFSSSNLQQAPQVDGLGILSDRLACCSSLAHDHAIRITAIVGLLCRLTESGVNWLARWDRAPFVSIPYRLNVHAVV